VECTSSPTSSPTVPPTTSSPTPCAGKTFHLKLKIDSYGGETSWKVTRQHNNNVNIVKSGSGYASNSVVHVEECIPNDACTFEIFDSHGDGLCCGFGRGSYQVWVDGVEKGSGGSFGSSDIVSLCSTMPTPSPTLAPFVTPTTGPNAGPTTAPSSAPTPLLTQAPAMPTAPTPNPAPIMPTTQPPSPPVSCLSIKVDISTDTYPEETDWTISDKTGNVVASGGGYTDKMTRYIQDVCLEIERIYTFSISDTYGDGICCEYYGSGSYKLYLGETAFIEGGHFFSSNQHMFLLVDQDTVMYYFERFFSLKRYSSETKNDNNEHSILPTYDHFPEQMNFYLGRGMKRVF